MPEKMTVDLFCSFCGKHQKEVKKLIAGPAVYICNEYVQSYSRIMAGMGTAKGIDRDLLEAPTGIRLYAFQVVDKVDDPDLQIALKEAQKFYPECEIGMIFETEIDSCRKPDNPDIERRMNIRYC